MGEAIRLQRRKIILRILRCGPNVLNDGLFFPQANGTPAGWGETGKEFTFGVTRTADATNYQPGSVDRT
jgi:hypothetical protein